MRKSVLLALFVAVQLLSVIVTQLIVIRNVGIGTETDSFIAAQTVAVVLAAILQAGLQSIWLPKLSAHVKRTDAWRSMLEAAISQSLLLSLAIFSLFAITSALWLSVLFSAFDAQQTSQTKIFFLVFSVASVLNTVSYQLTTALRTQDRFLSSEALNAIAVAASLPAIYHFAKPGELIFVAVITASRSLIIIITQLKLLNWPALRLRSSLSIGSNWNQMWPVLMGASVYKTLPLIDRSFAALAPAGGLTVFNLASSGVGALSSIFERSVCVPITAKFGRYVVENRFDQLRTTYRAGVAKISKMAALYFVTMLLIKPQFGDIATTVLKLSPPLSESLWWMCIYLIGYLHVAASGTLVVAVIQSLNDTKTPVRIAIIGFIFSLPLKALGFYFLGIKGIVLTSSIHYIGNMVLMTVLCERKIHDASSKFCTT